MPAQMCVQGINIITVAVAQDAIAIAVAVAVAACRRSEGVGCGVGLGVDEVEFCVQGRERPSKKTSRPSIHSSIDRSIASK